METKTLISKHLEYDFKSSNSSTFGSLKKRFNAELTRLHDNLSTIMEISFPNENIDKLSKLILQKYLAYIVQSDSFFITTEKTIWVRPNNYIDLSIYSDILITKFSNLDFSSSCDIVSSMILSDFYSFLETVIDSINSHLIVYDNSPIFSLENTQIRSFSVLDNSFQNIAMQISFSVDLI